VNPIFLSHSSKDWKHVNRLADALRAAGIPVWVSLRDIQPGRHWEQEIENALTEASAIVLLVSKDSVGSFFVHAEIQEAINQQKTVIPVRLGTPKLPLLWKSFQYLSWDRRSLDTLVDKIANALPVRAISEIRRLATKPSYDAEITRYVLRHVEWLPMEFRMAAEYVYKRKVRIASTQPVDVFAARMDSFGPRACLYYLGSAFYKPISANGTISARLRDIIQRANGDMARLTQPLASAHSVSPRRLLREKAAEWKNVQDSYARLCTYIVAGRSHHYGPNENRVRTEIECSHPVTSRLRIEIMSYDRLFKSAAQS
jgi:hypothetical protein